MRKKCLIKKQKSKQKQIAKERIIRLFEQAEQMFKQDPKYSNRYVELAIKISTKYKVRIPRELKRRICKKCKSYLVPNRNCVVRLLNKTVHYFCKICNHINRYPYVKEIKEKRRKK